jgi:hypothetical protein
MRGSITIYSIAFAFALCGTAASAVAQTISFEGAKAITSVTFEEVRQAIKNVGVTDIRDHTADANFPSFGGVHSQGASLQATLYACDIGAERCRGVQILSLIPATSVRNAEIIVGSIERSAFGLDAEVVELVNRPDAVAVMISQYLVYDYGVSDKLLAIALDQFSSVIDQTKGFMLKDDPAHADLWVRKN